jgi:hypothetical protein
VSASVLLQKLIEIERSIGVETSSTTRRRVLEAQDYLLRTNFNCNPGRSAEFDDDAQDERFALLKRFARVR